ncbi:hypothetical protein PENTCL1PPCAC_26514, partial [Pristionchus entomophagus]
MGVQVGPEAYSYLDIDLLPGMKNQRANVLSCHHFFQFLLQIEKYRGSNGVLRWNSSSSITTNRIHSTLRYQSSLRGNIQLQTKETRLSQCIL